MNFYNLNYILLVYRIFIFIFGNIFDVDTIVNI